MAGPLNAIKRTVIDGKSVILLDGPPQVLSWNEFKSICKLFEEVDWFDIAEVTGADFTSSMQVEESPTLKEVAAQHQLSKETVSYLHHLGFTSCTNLRKLTQDDISHLQIPMGQKRKVSSAVAQLTGKPMVPMPGSFRSKSTSGGRNVEGALAEHPKFWADHMGNSKLIRML